MRAALLLTAALALPVSAAAEPAPVERPLERSAGHAPASPEGPAARARGPLAARVERLERILDSGTLMDMHGKLQRLLEAASRLQGELEVQAHRLEELRRRQRELYLDLDRRLGALEQAVASLRAAPEASGPEGAAPGSGPTPQVAAASPSAGPATPGVAERVPPIPGGAPAAPPPSLAAVAPPAGEGAGSGGERALAEEEAEEEAYRAAFALLRDGRYQEAMTALRAFLERWPAGRYAGNATYWLGEAHYVTRDFQRAAERFREVVERHPGSPKAPDALLKLGFAQYELHRWAEAARTLEQVLARYPDSTAARLARQRLRRMQEEGRLPGGG